MGVVILQKHPTLSLLHCLEMIRDQPHALNVEIWGIAEPRELKHVHYIVVCQPLSQSFGASLLQLWDQKHMRQSQQMNSIRLHFIVCTPADQGFFKSINTLIKLIPIQILPLIQGKYSNL